MKNIRTAILVCIVLLASACAARGAAAGDMVFAARDYFPVRLAPLVTYEASVLTAAGTPATVSLDPGRGKASADEESGITVRVRRRGEYFFVLVHNVMVGATESMEIRNAMSFLGMHETAPGRRVVPVKQLNGHLPVVFFTADLQAPAVVYGFTPGEIEKIMSGAEPDATQAAPAPWEFRPPATRVPLKVIFRYPAGVDAPMESLNTIGAGYYQLKVHEGLAAADLRTAEFAREATDPLVLPPGSADAIADRIPLDDMRLTYGNFTPGDTVNYEILEFDRADPSSAPIYSATGRFTVPDDGTPVLDVPQFANLQPSEFTVTDDAGADIQTKNDGFLVPRAGKIEGDLSAPEDNGETPGAPVSFAKKMSTPAPGPAYLVHAGKNRIYAAGMLEGTLWALENGPGGKPFFGREYRVGVNPPVRLCGAAANGDLVALAGNALFYPYPYDPKTIPDPIVRGVISVMDLSAPLAPKLVLQRTFDKPLTVMALDGNLLLFAGYQGFFAMDLTNPEANDRPLVTEHLVTWTGAAGGVVAADTDEPRLILIDRSSLTEAGTWPAPGYFIWVRNGKTYVLTAARDRSAFLEIVDVTRPAAPAAVGKMILPKTRAYDPMNISIQVSMGGDTLYMTSCPGKKAPCYLDAWNTANPAAPRYISGIISEKNLLAGAAHDGKKLFVSSGNSVETYGPVK